MVEDADPTFLVGFCFVIQVHYLQKRKTIAPFLEQFLERCTGATFGFLSSLRFPSVQYIFDTT